MTLTLDGKVRITAVDLLQSSNGAKLAYRTKLRLTLGPQPPVTVPR